MRKLKTRLYCTTKLILTRIGFNSKFFISGDLEQSDKFKDITRSGLYDAKVRLDGLKHVGIHEFGNEDIVRNPLYQSDTQEIRVSKDLLITIFYYNSFMEIFISIDGVLRKYNLKKFDYHYKRLLLR